MLSESMFPFIIYKISIYHMEGLFCIEEASCFKVVPLQMNQIYQTKVWTDNCVIEIIWS